MDRYRCPGHEEICRERIRVSTGRVRQRPPGNKHRPVAAVYDPDPFAVQVLPVVPGRIELYCIDLHLRGIPDLDGGKGYGRNREGDVSGKSGERREGDIGRYYRKGRDGGYC